MTDYQYTTEAIDQYYSGEDQWKVISNHNITPEESESALGQLQNVNIVKSDNGKVVSYNFQAKENVTPDIEESINSNASPNIKSFEVPSSSGVETVTTEAGETVKQMTFKSGLSKAGNFVFGQVVPAIGAVATGITLGKTIDKLLYSTNPDFWDEHGMSSLNPDTWGDIVSNDSFGGKVFNMILGTTPDGKSQAYMDQNAFAYMALYMAEKGVFDKAESAVYENDAIRSLNLSTYIDFPIKLSPQLFQIVRDSRFNEENPDYSYTDVYSTSAEKVAIFENSTNNSGDGRIIFSSNNAGKYGDAFGEGILKPIPYENTSLSHKTLYNHELYASWLQQQVNSLIVGSLNIQKTHIPDNVANDIAYALLYGDTVTSGGIDGISDQDGAKTPNLSDDSSVEDVLDALKKQYPELWENAVDQDVAQPDGSTKTYTYVPVAMPEIDPEGDPVSSSSTQKDPQIDPAVDPDPLLDLISKIIQRDPPVNPPDIGSGITPVVPPATGSASSLYAIYNPTLAQINSFGAWLWSDNFVDQIKKLFNDPMQAIIGLHKVYATPATGGAQTIKVGYLDSGVSAKVVSNQYTTIDCGSVGLSEYFGNVFDYDPYTKVNLYLPFIGIVPLSVGEVMRSTIHVVYHVDVLTGACLAEVKIKRDSAGGTLFQYSGNAAVQYPISSGSYMGIVSGIMSIAGGVAGTIATGGAAMPVLLGAGASIGRMHTDISHSGNFSGNAGAMGIKKPYLIIDRPQTALAKNFPNYIGYPSNTTVKLSSCSGFTKVHEIHLENVPATNNELSDIEMKLKGGVII